MASYFFPNFWRKAFVGSPAPRMKDNNSFGERSILQEKSVFRKMAQSKDLP